MTTRRLRWASRSRGAVRFAAVVLAVTLAACGSSSTAAKAAPTLPSAPGAGHAFYVSIGDSYAAGYQPAPNGKLGTTSTNGFAYQLAAKATVHGKKLTLVNFGCGGATTSSVLHTIGCLPGRLGPGAVPYPEQTQADAATAFIAAHRSEMGLITVVISGNDITSCAQAKNTGAVVSCVTKALTVVMGNLHTLLSRVRAAAGPDVPIVGLTYPDVILGQYVSKTLVGHTLAALSVTAFKSLINPALKAEYEAIGATFIDVTAATDAYVPFAQTTTLAPYGTVPVAVAKACELTYYCQFHDIHPHTVGYTLIADLIRQSLPA